MVADACGQGVIEDRHLARAGREATRQPDAAEVVRDHVGRRSRAYDVRLGPGKEVKEAVVVDPDAGVRVRGVCGRGVRGLRVGAVVGWPELGGDALRRVHAIEPEGAARAAGVVEPAQVPIAVLGVEVVWGDRAQSLLAMRIRVGEAQVRRIGEGLRAGGEGRALLGRGLGARGREGGGDLVRADARGGERGDEAADDLVVGGGADARERGEDGEGLVAREADGAALGRGEAEAGVLEGVVRDERETQRALGVGGVREHGEHLAGLVEGAVEACGDDLGVDEVALLGEGADERDEAAGLGGAAGAAGARHVSCGCGFAGALEGARDVARGRCGRA